MIQGKLRKADIVALVVDLWMSICNQSIRHPATENLITGNERWCASKFTRVNIPVKLFQIRHLVKIIMSHYANLHSLKHNFLTRMTLITVAIHIGFSFKT